MNTFVKALFLILITGLLAACQQQSDPSTAGEERSTAEKQAETATVEDTGMEPESEPAYAGLSAEDRLAEVLAAQPEAMQARFDQRRPAETLAFFGVEPGMTVVEALPGGGWYSKILLPYLGSEGQLIGANYPIRLFEQFDFATPEYLESITNWPETFPEEAADWCEGDCASVSGFWLGQMPDEMVGAADAVLFVRALHNMARFQNEDIEPYLDQALADAYAALKPGGVLGIVQHESDEAMPDAWAAGQAGYLKRSFVIAAVEAAGFEFEEASDINANPNDQPTESDVVWRLPPSLGTTEEGSDERTAMEAIGESNRMTLKFRKRSNVNYR